MQSSLLFPQKCKKIGLVLFIPFLVLGIMNLFYEFQFRWLDLPVHLPLKDITTDYNLTNELAGIGILLSLLMIAFSKETKEDEFIVQVRLESLQWAVYVNYALLAICILFVNGTMFFQVIIYNMYTVLIFFILRFNFILYKTSRSASS
ncbi:hypothetical protein CLV51_103287 [Chitinophaga niastensis]|uniref:Uncharacterized protein n=1 Tax=Chitinophaga niastensis TaxID=536980 RepID=A0A2P8HJB4_CHINA|nr:hypothetical protein [Chitinophaga niastensis]PSL46309.1 hypothetical protein CLV51_103287 [Chitinophaga niastensis]